MADNIFHSLLAQNVPHGAQRFQNLIRHFFILHVPTRHYFEKIASYTIFVAFLFSLSNSRPA
jgi:hypothetical protein